MPGSPYKGARERGLSVIPLPASRLTLLEGQRRAGFSRLRFVHELEPEFRAEHAIAVVPRRVALLVTAIVLVAVTPVFDALFLHPPEGFVERSRLAQFGLQIPALALAGLATLWRPLRRWADAAALMAAFAVSAGVIYQRHIGAPFGYSVPSELVAVILTGTAVMAGLRLRQFAPTVLAILLLSAYSEVTTFGPTSETFYVIVAQVMLGTIAVVGTGMEEYAARKTWLQRKMLEELTLRDPLSGLVNARGLEEGYRRVFSTATREHRPLLVVAIDVDHFKAYNDHYGHMAGDDCLRRIASVLARQGRRGNDIVARTGGEEFVLVWYDVAPEHALRLLEAVRQDVERLAIAHAGIPLQGSVVTVSIGAVCAVPGPRLDPSVLLKVADEQLYLSKQRGRNRVSLDVLLVEAGPPATLRS
jgi:diguanylate cyclase (GGDEF)-like protein